MQLGILPMLPFRRRGGLGGGDRPKSRRLLGPVALSFNVAVETRGPRSSLMSSAALGPRRFEEQSDAIPVDDPLGREGDASGVQGPNGEHDGGLRRLYQCHEGGWRLCWGRAPPSELEWHRGQGQGRQVLGAERALCGDQGAARRLLSDRGARPRRGDRLGRALPGRANRRHRSAADLGDVKRKRRRGRASAVRNGIEKHAAFYRGYLIGDCSLVPLSIAWATIVALWLLVYLVTAIDPQAKLQTAQLAAQASFLVPTHESLTTMRS